MKPVAAALVGMTVGVIVGLVAGAIGYNRFVYDPARAELQVKLLEEQDQHAKFDPQRCLETRLALAQAYENVVQVADRQSRELQACSASGTKPKENARPDARAH